MSLRVAAVLLSLAAATTTVRADTYPSKPVHMVVPYPAGGPTDVLARKVAAALSTELGQQVITDNRAGANGVIGTEYVAQAPADGYTFLMTGIDQHVGNRLMYKRVPYDAIAAFTPVTQIASVPLVLVVNPALDVRSVHDLAEQARSEPGKISYASSSVGSLSHLAGEQFKILAGVDMVHVPYKGGGPAMTDVVGGQVPVYFAGINMALPCIKAQRLRPLAVTGTQRVAVLPDVPTMTETAEFKGYEATLMFATWLPAHTPQQVVAALNRATVTAIQSPPLKAFFESEGSGPPIGNSPEQMSDTIQAVDKRLPAIIKAAGITPE